MLSDFDCRIRKDTGKNCIESVGSIMDPVKTTENGIKTPQPMQSSKAKGNEHLRILVFSLLLLHWSSPTYAETNRSFATFLILILKEKSPVY